MNIKFIFTKCITLLYRESQVTKAMVSSKSYVRDIISEIKINESNLTLDHDSRIMSALRDVLLDMIRKEENFKYNYQDFNQSLRLACEDNEALYESIRDGILIDKTDGELIDQITSIRHELNNHLREQKAKKVIAEAYSRLTYKPHEVKNLKDYINQLIADLTPYQTEYKEEEDPAIISLVDFSNPEQIAEVLRTVKKEASGDLVIKTPWQALNRMLRGGFRRGQMTCVAALQHHGKSLLTLGSLIGAAIYNDANEQLIDKEKKPALMVCSTEDEMTKIIASVYMTLRENLDLVKCDDEHMASISEEDASVYISEKMRSRGYSFLSLRVNPSEWTYIDLCNFVSKLEAQSYEIHVALIDYLNMFPKTGCFGDNEPARIQNLFQRVRNFMAARKIACITPHQLSADALELFRQGKKDLVNIVSGGNYYADCKGIGRELDCELFLCKVEENGRYYMTIRRGKHRINGKTEEKYLYTVLPFEDMGSLRFDIDGPDTSLSKIGAKRREDGTEELPFYDDF